MVDVDLLMKVIEGSGMKICAICNKAGISRRVFYNRTTTEKSYLFNVREIDGLARVLDMDDETVMRVFFAKKREKNERRKGDK